MRERLRHTVIDLRLQRVERAMTAISNMVWLIVAWHVWAASKTSAQSVLGNWGALRST